MMESDSSYSAGPGQIASSPHHALPSSPPQTDPSRKPTTNTSPSASPSSLRIVPAVVHENPFAQGEDAKTYFRRKNRYFGPASTWLSWTEQERTTALSLDRVRSQDLSIHLFNAFGLKRKAQTLRGRGTKRRRKGKERARSVSGRFVTDEDSEDESRSSDRRIALAKSWTAWPMSSDQVPRQDLMPHIFEIGLRRTSTNSRPSADLEAWVVATATRVAREQWDARGWEIEKKPFPKRDMKIEHEEPLERMRGRDDEVSSGDDDDQIIEEAELSPSAQSGDEPMFYSQPAAFFDDHSSTKNEESDYNSEDPQSDRRPVPLADDEKARQAFLPSARHILAKLDDLLLGLHKARYAYAAKSQGRARGRSSQSQSQTSETSQDRGRSNQSRSRSRRRRARSSSIHSDIPNVSNMSVASRRRPRRIQKLQLRDWSDIMGMASLTGWSPAIVERASERCARLFGENMLFRTFHDGEGNEGAESHFIEQLALERVDLVRSDEDDEASPTREDEILVVRSSRPCSACQTARIRCQPANEETGISRVCKSCQEVGTTCSRITVRSIDKARVCPHRSCPRHTVPFYKQYHLQRHMDAMHAPTARSMSRSRATSMGATSTEAYTSDDVTARSSSVPFSPSSPVTREILCPISSCPRSRQSFSKGKKLYEHIRRMHPEVNVDAVKRREATKREEKRGRWRDERRRRSKSRGVSQGRGPSQGQGRSRVVTTDDSEEGDEGIEDDQSISRYVDEDVDIKYED